MLVEEASATTSGAIALGLLLIAIADTASRSGADWAEVLFWAGLLMMFAPVAARLASPGTPRHERMWLLLWLGMATYLVKVFQSPLGFTFVDEFQHYRTANDIISTGHLFQPNPILPVSPFYPGLEIAVAAVSNVTGLGIFGAAIVLVGAARLVLVVVLYLFFEEISKSARQASIASLLFMGNPSYLFFHSMFAYESLAFPLGLLLLFSLARLARRPEIKGMRVGLNLTILLCLGALVATHHATSFLIVAFILLWTAIPILRTSVHAISRPFSHAAQTRFNCDLLVVPADHAMDRYNKPVETVGDRHVCPNYMAVRAVSVVTVWLVYVAPIAVSYITPMVSGSVSEFLGLIAREEAPRELFRSYSGVMAPLWDRGAVYAWVLLALSGIPLGLLRLPRRYRGDNLALSLAVVAVAFPFSLMPRLTPIGVGISGRLQAFVFVGVAFVLAVAAESWLQPPNLARKAAVFTFLAVALVTSGVTVNWAWYSRLPGPYAVGSDSRSISVQGVSTAEWALQFLGPHNRLATDWTNQLLMGSYGGQDPVLTGAATGPLSSVFFSDHMSNAEKEDLKRAGIRYVVVDRRLSRELPLVGFYFDAAEPEAFRHRTPIAPDFLAKFDHVENVSLVFDSGDIAIYDLKMLLDDNAVD